MPSDIGAAFASAIAGPAFNLTRSIGKKRYNEFIAIYTDAFKDFLKTTEHRCARVKTILNQEASVSLREIYVNLNLKFGNSSYFSDAGMIEQIRSGSAGIAVLGLAGSGKSMLMRWLALTLLETLADHQRIPLFLEVRDLDFTDDQSLEETIFLHCAHPGSSRNIDQLRIGLREGLFVVLLDGIDEVSPERIGMVLKKVKKFREEFAPAPIVASGRPGTQLTTIASLKAYTVQPLSVDQVIEILEKAPYDSDRKRILIEALKGGLYDVHKSFLSNPLLVSITLITFDDASRIPENLTGFYAAAFDALFTKHDWAKGIFIRKRFSGLEKAEFESVFQYLCYLSYIKSCYSFSNEEITFVAQEAIKLAGMTVKVEEYLRDCVMSVCLLIYDEPKIVFVHRSFQEYFTAKLISGYSGAQLYKLIDFVSSRSNTDNTFLMVAQLNREAVIRSWAVAKVDDIVSRFESYVQNGESEKVYLDLGITTISCDLKSGEINGFGGKENSQLDELNAVFTLTQDFPSGKSRVPISGNIYGGRALIELEPELRRFIHRCTDGAQVVQFNVPNWQASRHRFGVFDSAAIRMIDDLKYARRSFQEFLSARDSLADLVEAIQHTNR